jgi:hypothetical protein
MMRWWEASQFPDDDTAPMMLGDGRVLVSATERNWPIVFGRFHVINRHCMTVSVFHKLTQNGPSRFLGDLPLVAQSRSFVSHF